MNLFPGNEPVDLSSINSDRAAIVFRLRRSLGSFHLLLNLRIYFVGHHLGICAYLDRSLRLVTQRVIDRPVVRRSRETRVYLCRVCSHLIVNRFVQPFDAFRQSIMLASASVASTTLSSPLIGKSKPKDKWKWPIGAGASFCWFILEKYEGN